MAGALVMHNAESGLTAAIPVLGMQDFRRAVIEAVDGGRRIASMFASPLAEPGTARITAVLAHDLEATLALVATDVAGSYPALTPECPQAHLFEREIAEQGGVTPAGHPWLKPVRSPEATAFFRVEGEEIHEVAVGPVHAGIIEPGHFRFQCHGENVLHLEIALGYQHRGVERALERGDPRRARHYAETLAGDTTIGHALAHAHAIEALCGFRTPPRAQVLRAIALELERLANHAGDLGALAGDVGYLPTASFCGRIRGDLLNLQALICGSRFGRGMVVPGGVAFDVDAARLDRLAAGLQAAFRDLADAAQLLWDSPSVLARFDDVGAIAEERCRELGLVGPAARACGVPHDVRQDFPTGAYRFFHVPACTWHRGDVFARAFVRWLEVNRSVAFIEEQVRALPAGPVAGNPGAMRGDRTAVALVEGWRGEICHVVATDARGAVARYKVVDPSFHNWMGLALAQRGCQVSDFPLNNKSFNLSYCGHDL